MKIREFQTGEEALYDVEEERVLVHLPSEIDDHVSRHIREELEQLMQHRKVKRLIFDFANVNFMDSSGIGLLLNSYRRMRERGGTVSVFGVDRRMNRMLAISGIYQVIDCISQ